MYQLFDTSFFDLKIKIIDLKLWMSKNVFFLN